MQSTGHTSAPEPTGGLRARFSRRPEETRLHPTEARVIDLLQRAVDERLEDGLLAIEEQARDLMREIAAEMWRTSGRDLRPEQERIVSLLSRDQAIKSLIATNDERFQALAVRAARLEDLLGELADTGRGSRADIQEAVSAVRELVASPTVRGVERIRAQLEQVEEHIAATMQHLDERDRELTEGVLARVREHGELVAHETTRVFEAIQGYIESGTEAMGQLTSRIEGHAETFAAGTASLDDLHQRSELLVEQLGINGRSMDEMQRAVERLVEARVAGLAQLIRADSEALRARVEERVAELAGLIRDDSEALRSVIEGRVSESHEAAIQTLEQRTAEVREGLARHVDSMGEGITEQVTALAAAITTSVQRGVGRVAEQMAAIDGIDTMLAETQSAAEERLRSHVDERIGAIARLVRSDNEALAQRIDGVNDQDQIRTILRSVKELEAGLAAEVSGSIDRRFQQLSDQLHQESRSTTEAMLKIAEALSQRIDRLAVRVDEGVGSDLQIVIDRMSDAIQAMSGRATRQSA
jgi:uncharacterized protein YukE